MADEEFSANFEVPVPPLYKFQPYCTDPFRDRAQKTLLEGAIYFARPPEFNDPFEARPHFVRSTSDVREWKRELVKFAQLRFGGSRQQRRAAARGFAKKADPALANLRETQRRDLATGIAIYSMSAVRDDLLLWAHYAAQHTGLCIHIDHTRPPFSVALPVHYSESYPEITFPRNESDRDTYIRLLYTKAKTWEYEREYRLCRVEAAPERSRDLGMRWDGQIAFAPADRFVGVTLGARMPEPCRKEVVALANKREVPLAVWQASVHDTKYQLKFDRIV